MRGLSGMGVVLVGLGAAHVFANTPPSQPISMASTHPKQSIQELVRGAKQKILDQEIEELQKQIEGMGVLPETEHYYPKNYVDTHFKHASLSKRAKKIKSYNIAKEKSGFFLGGGYALGMLEESYSSSQVIDGALGIKVSNDVFQGPVVLKGWANMLNLELGYQRYFNPYFGTRLYGDLLFEPGLGGLKSNGGGTQDGGKFFYALGSLDMDALFDAPLDRQREHFLGGYLGFGIGLMFLSDHSHGALQQVQNSYTSRNVLWKMLMQVDYTINLGMAFTYKRHLRFELGTKIPLTYLRLGFETPATYSNAQGSRTLISSNTGFKRSSFLVMNVLYMF